MVIRYSLPLLFVVLLTFFVDMGLYLRSNRTLGIFAYFEPDVVVGECKQWANCPKYLAERDGLYKPVPYAGQTDRVLLVTPVFHKSSRLLSHLTNLCCLSYPTRQLSIVILQGYETADDYDDATTASNNDSASSQLTFSPDFKNRFARFDVVPVASLITAWAHPPAYADRPAGELFSKGTQFLDVLKVTEDWLLWIDLDVEELPSDLIQRLLLADRDIVVPMSRVSRSNETRSGRHGDRQRRKKAFWKMRRKGESAHREKLARLYRLWLESERLKPGGSVNTTEDPLPDPPKDDEVSDEVSDEVDWAGEHVAFVRSRCYTIDLLLPAMLEKHLDLNESFGLALIAETFGTSLYVVPDLLVIHN